MPDSTYSPEVFAASRELEAIPARQRIGWAVREYGSHLTFACSFGAEDVVVLDMLLQADPSASVFVLDTGRLPQETYDLMDRARERCGRSFAVYAPDTDALQRFLSREGANPFYRSVALRQECCRVRKVEPLARALAGRQAWLTGLRRGQSVTRALLPVIEIDETHGGIAKLNPLADWAESQVWDYVRERGLPHNALHAAGFPSIGCAPCTRAVSAGDDVRAGRWWWEAPEHRECGLHVEAAPRAA